MELKEKPQKLKYDMKIAIATGGSRKETEWKNKELLWSEFVEKCRTTTRTTETVEEFKKFTKAQQDERKDVGGFVGGTLKGGRRTAANVAWRQVVTLDADFAKPDFWNRVQDVLGSAACLIYSTHKHTPDNYRLRLVTVLSRPVSPDEYQAITRRIAADIGIDLFDGTTFEPHRLMYWPSTPSDGVFLFEVQDGPWLDADTVLARYSDWRDQSLWPEPAKAAKDRKRLADKQGDPLAKTGIVGAFCRTYSVLDVLEQFLPDIYSPCAVEGRYTYIAGTAAGGLILYEDKFAFSHHGTDPISGKLVNAFDLYRLHKFGELDDEAAPGTPVVKMPSYTEMLNFCTQDAQVKRTLGEERLAEAEVDFNTTDNNWLEKFEINNNGQYLSTPRNAILIMHNDPNVSGKIALNDFSHRVFVKGDLPWRNLDRGDSWSDSDDSDLRNYISMKYGIKGNGIITDAWYHITVANAYHPVREYLRALIWDGIQRIDTLIIDYLAAPDNIYTRTVTRKTLLAAVSRVFVPGIKYDDVLVLLGEQRAGKSLFLRKLAKNWFSDSFTTFQGKEAYEQLQGAWIIEMGEMTASTRAETEVIKQFLSKQEDTYRPAYGRQVAVVKRQNIFVGTTNVDNYLKDKTGNRRFRTIRVEGFENHKCTKKLFVDLDKEVDQIWAETVEIWNIGKEDIYLSPEMEVMAADEQDIYLDEHPMAGPVREYLEILLPTNWSSMEVGERRTFIHDRDLGEYAIGTEKRMKVCALEIWAELYKGDMGKLSNVQSREINDILRKTKGWGRPIDSKSGMLRFGNIYGKQRAFVRF